MDIGSIRSLNVSRNAPESVLVCGGEGGELIILRSNK